jgi:hypothetical protein
LWHKAEIAQKKARGSTSDAKRLLQVVVGFDSDKGIYRNELVEERRVARRYGHRHRHKKSNKIK